MTPLKSLGAAGGRSSGLVGSLGSVIQDVLEVKTVRYIQPGVGRPLQEFDDGLMRAVTEGMEMTGQMGETLETGWRLTMKRRHAGPWVPAWAPGQWCFKWRGGISSFWKQKVNENVHRDGRSPVAGTTDARGGHGPGGTSL